MSVSSTGQQFGGYVNNLLQVIQGQTRTQCENLCLANAQCEEASYVTIQTNGVCVLYSGALTLETTDGDESVNLRKNCTPGKNNDICYYKIMLYNFL